MPDSQNPFLTGNYAPWRVEGDASNLEIEGELPSELNGTLYRIGPNPHFPPRGRYHWFDGDGMVHAFTLAEGRARYRNRYVRTAGLQAELKRGRALFGGLIDISGEPPADLPPEVGPFKNAANTNIIFHARRLLALWEAGLPHELSPETLETTGTYNFCGRLNGPMTAHPKTDPETGELLFFGYQPFPPYVTYHRADSSGNLTFSQPIDTGLPVMMHDFVTTRDHIIFFVCPSVFRIENASRGEPLINWEPQHGTRIGVMRRSGGELGWFETDPCYIFHFLNAYEEQNSLVVDACRFERLDMTGNSFGPPPFAHRFRLDFASGKVRVEKTDDIAGDFPRINDSVAGLKHRFGYFAGARDGSDTLGFNVLIKRDYQSGRSEQQGLGSHMSPGEPVFVPSKRAAAEDDGFILATWYDARENRSELVVLDAANFAGKPLARVKLQHRVPFGFHGNWVGGTA